jgi:hypothetical protein
VPAVRRTAIGALMERMTADSSRQAVGQRLHPQRLGLAAAGIVVVEALLAAIGHPSRALALAVLFVAPGLALAALLPVALRTRALALACAVPVLGFAVTSIGLITVARVGIRLDGTTTRLVVAAIVLAGLLALPLREPIERPGASETILLGAALLAGVVLQAHVIHGFPVPGNDWAKYVLYADEIRHHGRLLIDNPYWMLGVPFREDPGAPSLYGAFLIMTGAPVSTLAHGIWIFALLGIASVFAYVRTLWGPVAGGLAALLYAVLPINQDILGWHGLANVAALAIIPLVLLGATELLAGRVGRREALGLALLLVGLAAAHRLSATVSALTLGLAGVIALVVGPRRAILRGAALTAAGVAVVGWGVASHLIAVNRTFGGTQGYRAYLGSKLDPDLVVRDLTWTFSVAAALGVLWALVALRRRPELLAPLALLAVLAALSYSWVVHLPLAYLRMAYYLPAVLAPLLAGALAALLGRRRPWIAAVAGAVLAAAIAVPAWDRGADVRRFYSFADPASLRGLDMVAAHLRPGEPVVTDRCWSFLGTWLLHTRTLPALYPEDIQPKAELPFARRAESILQGRPAGVALARRLGVRYLIVDPTCVDPHGRVLDPPLVGDPRYVSDRLVVLQLPPDPRRGSRSVAARSS